MASEKIKAFIDTNVLLRYIGGEPELQPLFSPEVLQQVTFVVNPVVLQELLFTGLTHARLTALTRNLQVNVISTPDSVPQTASTDYKLHANDLLILGSARQCDVLLTYDRGLLSLGDAAEVNVTTPDVFLASLKNRS